MRYYIGHWQWTTGNGMACYAPPAGVVGCLDLGTLPQMSVGGANRGRLLCWTQDDVTLPSEYELLGVGDCRELNTDGAMLDAFESLVGYRPQGAKLVDAFWDCLEGGADIDGATGPLPLVPTTQGNLELHFAGHSVVKSRRFKWGNDAASPKLKQLLRKEFRGLLQDAKAGKLKDDKHHLRVLDYWCDKYGVSDWREFVPANSQKDVPGRVKHETTLTDNFNRASLGSSWSTSRGSGLAISASTVVTSGGGFGAGRFDSDLSSADHYAQITVTARSISSAIGIGSRLPSSGEDSYTYVERDTSTPTRRLFKRVSTTDTLIASDSTAPGALPHAIKVECNGSTIKAYESAVAILTTTDSSITGNLRCGLQCSSTSEQGDDFIAADLAAGPSGSPWNYYAQQG